MLFFFCSVASKEKHFSNNISSSAKFCAAADIVYVKTKRVKRKLFEFTFI
jgi:hypothetical protein